MQPTSVLLSIHQLATPAPISIIYPLIYQYHLLLTTLNFLRFCTTHHQHTPLCLSSLQPSYYRHSGSTTYRCSQHRWSLIIAATECRLSALIIANCHCNICNLVLWVPIIAIANEQSMRSTGTISRRGHYHHHNAHPIIYHLPVCCNNMSFHWSCISNEFSVFIFVHQASAS